MLSRLNPHFIFPTPSIFGNHAVGRVVPTSPDSVTPRKGHLVFVNSCIEASDDPEVAILLGLMDGGSEKSKKVVNDAWRNGTRTTHALVPLENATPLDEDALLGKLGYDVTELAYLPRLGVAYGGMSTINVKAGGTVIVGPATGLVVLSSDINKDPNAIQAFGPADASVDFSPTVAKNVTHISSAIRALRRRERVAFMGGTSADAPIPYSLVTLNSIEIKGRWMYSRKGLRGLITMVEN
ncbi:hypothetical protein DL771_004153 [Monosporascus sp. 5C6A]|nr:hypothetical protein DL771_004153 [Monosporascus sp. 5C6A]